MEEYKIIQGSAAECQKWLNQWKHEYELKIIQMCAEILEGTPQVTILLIRDKK